MHRHRYPSFPDSWSSGNYKENHTREQRYAGHLRESLQKKSIPPMSVDDHDSDQWEHFCNKFQSYTYQTHRQPVLRIFPHQSSNRGKLHHKLFPEFPGSDFRYSVPFLTDVHFPKDVPAMHYCKKSHFRFRHRHKALHLPVWDGHE